ncbi:MAG: carboxypeptidase M32 [Actinomycetota bacterium]
MEAGTGTAAGPVETVLAKWSDIASIGSAAAVLAWDQETLMPPQGGAQRGASLAVLAGLHHDQLVDPALIEAIDDAGSAVEAGSENEAHLREARRAVERARAVPGDLAREFAAARSRSMQTWQQARADSDFAAFAPMLRELVGLVRQEADAYIAAGLAETRYDALVDQYEPGTTEAELAVLLGDLRDELTPLVKAVADSGVIIDESPARGVFSEEAQLALGRQVAEAIGFDFGAGRLDLSAHPFTTRFGAGDVRITWRYDDDDFRSGLFGIMHEVGHGLYEQGLPSDYARTPLGDAVSLGVHESQSRLWENLVGRSRAFWEWALPVMQRHLPSTDEVTVDALFPALNTVVPSLIRVEADQGTYNLHIVARFEIERRLISGDVEIDDLPDLWDDTYEELLGVRAPDVATGVLQDIHWAMGSIGYFPTYTLGNLMASQLFDAAARDVGDLTGQLSRGEFGPLLEWLRTHVHAHGRRIPAPELIEQATGAPLSSAAFLDHIRSTTADVYGVSA